MYGGMVGNMVQKGRDILLLLLYVCLLVVMLVVVPGSA
jgi:hypothetical protein